MDEEASIGVIVYKSKLRSLKYIPKNGENVIIYGSLSLYIKGGEYRIVAEHIKPVGRGKRFFDLEQLKREFKEKGYFDRKRPISAHPKRVILITSPTGAAVKDIINIVKRRAASFELLIYPVAVQGQEAKSSILRAFEDINAINEQIDVVVLTRGGGSSEDLWIFNDPEVALAFYNVKFPTISAIGHEIDFTLCDFVADLRAETPSAAAELLTKSRKELSEKLAMLKSSINSGMLRVIHQKENSLALFSTMNLSRRLVRFINERMLYLDNIAERINSYMHRRLISYESKLQMLRATVVRNSPTARLSSYAQRVEFSKKLIKRGIDRKLAESEKRLLFLAKQIENLSPMSILKKGYSITFDQEGRALRDPASLKKGDTITTVLSGGQIVSTVDQIAKKGLS